MLLAIIGCSRHNTPQTDYGGGDKRYLVRQRINCNNDVLSQFKLAVEGNNMKYGYTCCNFLGNCSVESKETPYKARGGSGKNITIINIDIYSSVIILD